MDVKTRPIEFRNIEDQSASKLFVAKKRDAKVSSILEERDLRNLKIASFIVRKPWHVSNHDVTLKKKNYV